MMLQLPLCFLKNGTLKIRDGRAVNFPSFSYNHERTIKAQRSVHINYPSPDQQLSLTS
jgi:hypothetical protein